MSNLDHDKLFINARIYIPGSGFASAKCLGVTDGVISEIADAIDISKATTIIDVKGKILTAGLIDMHTHIYHKANMACVDPLPVAKRSGATTMVDAGTSGASSIEGLVDYVFKPSPLRLLAFINISYAGIFGFHPEVRMGETEDNRLLNIKLCCEAIEKYRQHIVGIKVRIGRGESGENGHEALSRALNVSQQLDLPLMAHIGIPPLDIDELLDKLRPGDILTHCFRDHPNSLLLDNNEAVRDAVGKARARGVLFDIGHGFGSFSFESAKRMVSEGFLPDTISSDVHQFCVNGPAFDLLHVSSKLLALGVPLESVIDMMTINASKALKRADIGRVEVGGTADLVILNCENRDIDFVDSSGVSFKGKQLLSAVDTYFAGTSLS